MKYNFVVTNETLGRIIKFSKKSPSIIDNLLALELDPFKKGKLTYLPIVAEYYVNCGRFVILYNVSEVNHTVIIIDVVLSALLHKIMIGKIAPNTISHGSMNLPEQDVDD